MVQRFFFELAYNGSEFFGWQIQPNQNSIQEEIERALSKLNSNEPIKVVGCGRTDTGVHAYNYFLHVDLPEKLQDELSLCFKLNRMLPQSIVIQRIFKVKPEAHARFNATKRTYRYFINTKKNPFEIKTSTLMTKDFDLEKMNEAAQYLIGKQDFTSLSKLHTDVKTNICTVSKAHWFENGDKLVFEISADRFLRNMVRATVGTLLEVGEGKIQAEDIVQILKAKDRGEAKVSAPAEGLFLWKIDYDWTHLIA